ncbi:MAG: ATP-binding protein [Thermoleophilia bacterium]|nr:ATP-binding protein [Thermoleophilia bacterium]
MADRPYIARHAERLARESLGDTRVVVLQGARQTGKSTLARIVGDSMSNTAFRFLDRDREQAAARFDPAAYVQHEGLLVIDEIQTVPSLVAEIKAEVDEDPRPGRFLLTGSARLLALAQIPDSLVGRAEYIELWPLSQGEIEESADAFVDAAFNSTMRSRDGVETPQGYAERVVRGGFPEAVVRPSAAARSRFLAGYLDALIERDVRQVSEIERTAELARLVRASAASTAQLLVVERMARELRIPARTLDRHLAVLEHVYLLKRIPAWANNRTHRATKTPKLAFVDSGLAAHVAGVDAKALCDIHNPLRGPFIESFAAMEIARQLTWSTVRARQYHYRSKDGAEVDIVIEAPDGRIVGIEVKASTTVTSRDFRGLRHLARAAGDGWVRGVVLHLGTAARSFGDGFDAMPLERLWT